MSLRFSRNSEEFALEFLDNNEEMFVSIYTQWCIFEVSIFNHTIICYLPSKVQYATNKYTLTDIYASYVSHAVSVLHPIIT